MSLICQALLLGIPPESTVEQRLMELRPIESQKLYTALIAMCDLNLDELISILKIAIVAGRRPISIAIDNFHTLVAKIYS